MTLNDKGNIVVNVPRSFNRSSEKIKLISQGNERDGRMGTFEFGNSGNHSDETPYIYPNGTCKSRTGKNIYRKCYGTDKNSVTVLLREYRTVTV